MILKRDVCVALGVSSALVVLGASALILRESQWERRVRDLEQRLNSAAAAVRPKDRSRPSSRTAIASDDAAVEHALRARVQELERQLADSAATAERTAAEPSAERPSGGQLPNGEKLRENFERFRREHPEDFARMEERRKDFVRRRQERAQSQIDFLSSVDTATMDPEARETHRRLMELIAQRQEREARITPEAVMNATVEERRKGFEELMASEREMNALKEQEREILLRQTAAELGFSGSDAEAVVETISTIYEATASSGFGGHGGQGRHGGRRGR